jgi:hypothetical protein
MNDVDRMLLVARLRNPSVEACLAHIERQYPGIAAGADVTVNKVWLCGLWLKACEAEREAIAARLEAACARWPDDPQIQAVLRGEAEDIRNASN